MASSPGVPGADPEYAYRGDVRYVDGIGAMVQTPGMIKPVSDPIFHDMVKAFIHYEYKQVFELCKNIPTLNKSSLLKNNKWILESRDQEFLTHTKFRSLSKIDVVWFFKHHDPQFADTHKYRIIHEVKTGRYDIDEIFNKYYSGMETQIWIWGWRKFNSKTTPTDPKCVAKVKQGLVKTADIEYLVPMICPYLKMFYNAFNGDVWCASL